MSGYCMARNFREFRGFAKGIFVHREGQCRQFLCKFAPEILNFGQLFANVFTCDMYKHEDIYT